LRFHFTSQKKRLSLVRLKRFLLETIGDFLYADGHHGAEKILAAAFCKD